MELIFDSIEERDLYFSSHCPGEVGLKEFEEGLCKPSMCSICKKCWENSGVKYSIKGPTPDHPVPIHMQEGSTVTLVCDEYLRPGDKLVCKDGVWGVERAPENDLHGGLHLIRIKDAKIQPIVIDMDITQMWPGTVLDKIKERNKTRACVDCKYYGKDCTEEPCCRCDAIEHDKFEKKEEEVERCCKNCEHHEKPWEKCYWHCDGCGPDTHYRNFKLKEG